MSKRLLSQVVGVIFILFGLLGFVNHPVFGLFVVNALHNLIYIISGVLGLILVIRETNGALLYGQIMTVIYGLVTIIGYIQGNTVLGLIPVDSWDNLLHLVLTLVFIYIGFVPTADPKQTTT